MTILISVVFTLYISIFLFDEVLSLQNCFILKEHQSIYV